MKKIIATLILTLAAVSAFAQRTVVTGAVLDSLSMQGEPGAVLQFFKSNDKSKAIAFTTTDADGNFSQAISGKGDYDIVYQEVGRVTITKHFTLSGEPEVKIGNILAQDDVEVLEGAVKTELRTLVKMDVDKMTYKVEDDVDAKSSTVLDMLRKVPMVSVDGEDNITVNGSSSFQVLVDGKPNVMISSNPSQVFKSMPASAIKDIQVITNPGVKYDAEGVGGILNITTNRAQQGGAAMPELDGYNATVGFNGSTRFKNGWGAGLRSFVSGQKGKFTYSANLNLNTGANKGTTSESEQSMIARDPLDYDKYETLSSTINSSTSHSSNLMGMASLDLGYEIDPLRLISASAGFMMLGSNSASDQLTSMLFGGSTMGYGSTMNSKMSMKSITASIDYQRSFADNADRSFVFSYQLSSRPMNSWSETIFDDSGTSMFDMTDRYSQGPSNTLQNTLQIDYSDKWAGCLTFNAGAKYISRINKSNQEQYFMQGGSWALNDFSSSNYRNDSNIPAAYVQLSYGAKSFSAKAGVRYEHTFQSIKYLDGKGNDLKVNYPDFVPAASIQYNITMQQNIGLSYNMRIRRPGITFLDPYKDISDPTRLMYGNSDLKTEKAHTVNLVYNYFAKVLMLNVTLRDTYCGNGISNYSFYDDNHVLNTTYGNILKSNSIGLNVYANINIGSKTRIMLNASGSYSTMDNALQDLHNSGWNGMGMLGIQQTLPWDLRASANFMGTTRNRSVDGWRSGMSMAMASLTKTFLDDKLSVALNGTIPLKKNAIMVMESHSAGPDYINNSKNIMPMANLSLNVSYSFGNKKGIRLKKARTSISNDDLMDRSDDSGSEGGESSGASQAGGGMMGGRM